MFLFLLCYCKFKVRGEATTAGAKHHQANIDCDMGVSGNGECSQIVVFKGENDDNPMGLG